jgi:hypothetical protein
MKFSTFKIALVAPVIAVTLSACGGGTSGISGFEDLGNKADGITKRVNDIGEYDAESDTFKNKTEVGEMPTQGTAAYAGVAGLWLNDDQQKGEDDRAIGGTPEVAAEISLTADFETSEISGSLTNFQASKEDDTLNGTVDISGGSISGGNLNANLSGTLGGNVDGQDEEHTFTGAMTGTFLGDNAEAAVGYIDGSLSDGTFVAGEWEAVQD